MDPFCWSSQPPAEMRTTNVVLALSTSSATLLRYAVSGATTGTIELAVVGDRRGRITHDVAAFASEATAVLAELAARTSQLVHLELACSTAADADVARQLGFSRTHANVWSADCDDLIAWHHVRSVATAANANISVAGDTGAISVRSPDGVILELAIANASNEPYVTASTPIGRRDQFSSDDSLLHTSSLVVGALAVRDDQLELRYGCTPSGLTANCLSLLLHEAARLRSLVPTPTIHLDAFACAL